MSALRQRYDLTGGKLFDPSIDRATEAQEARAPEPRPSLRIYEPPPPSRRHQKPPPVGDDDSIQGAERASELRDACVALACRARDAFNDACSTESPDESEASFASVKSLIEELWEYAYVRDRPFRDLLALLDAALKRAELMEFSETQRDVLSQAFADLPRWMLDDTAVEGHIDRFAEHDVDITGPLRAITGKRVRVTLEVIEE